MSEGGNNDDAPVGVFSLEAGHDSIIALGSTAHYLITQLNRALIHIRTLENTIHTLSSEKHHFRRLSAKQEEQIRSMQYDSDYLNSKNILLEGELKSANQKLTDWEQYRTLVRRDDKGNIMSNEPPTESKKSKSKL